MLRVDSTTLYMRSLLGVDVSTHTPVEPIASSRTTALQSESATRTRIVGALNGSGGASTNSVDTNGSTLSPSEPKIGWPAAMRVDALSPSRTSSGRPVLFTIQ
jgi:hypothetical protein